MVRGTFANIRIKNLMLPGVSGGYTLKLPENTQMTIFEASEKYLASKIPLAILAGKEYGSGSSRDWAAKGPALLGVKFVIAESFERIHRSNLVGMGILPLQFLGDQNVKSLGLTGLETFEVTGIAKDLKARQTLKVKAFCENGKITEFEVLCRIDTPIELEYYRYGGVLCYVLCKLLSSAGKQPVAA
jgi:aconitate hydratase